MILKLITVFICSILYAVVRYVIFGNISLVHMPVYLLNKSISLSSVIFLFCTALSYFKNHKYKTRYWGAASFHSACIHILLSLTILTSGYYPKFFGPEKMNLTGEVTMLFGVLAAYSFWNAHRGNIVSKRPRIFPLLACIFVIAHLIAMGFIGWLKVEQWHGCLAPISLISFLFALVSLGLFLKSRKGARLK